MATETQLNFTGSQVNSYIHAYIFFSHKDRRLVMAKKKERRKSRRLGELTPAAVMHLYFFFPSGLSVSSGEVDPAGGREGSTWSQLPREMACPSSSNVPGGRRSTSCGTPVDGMSGGSVAAWRLDGAHGGSAQCPSCTKETLPPSFSVRQTSLFKFTGSCTHVHGGIARTYNESASLPYDTSEREANIWA
jgi:hypothetical protein